MDNRAYEQLKFYQDICEIRRMVYQITEKFDKKQIRLISQMRDAARSAKQNIREGYRRGSLNEFIRSIRISQGSLEELSGDIEDCMDDGLITVQEYDKFHQLYQSAAYLSYRYLESMSRPVNREKWKMPGQV